MIHWSDRRTGDPQSICVKPNTKTILAHSNTATVSFITNSEVDAQGFRLFYSEGTLPQKRNSSLVQLEFLKIGE